MSSIVLMLVSAVPAVDPLPEQFHFDLSSGLETQPLLKLIGPNARQVTQTDTRGLRITLPAQRPQSSPVGVEPRFRLRGDFEVTLSYELLAAQPPPLPRGAGVVLSLRFDGSPPQTVTLTRVRKLDKEKPFVEMFGTNLAAAGSNAKNKFNTQMSPASKMQGQLRLVRTGESLHFLVSDGPNASFQKIRVLSVGSRDVKTLQAQCTTGGKEASVDVRLHSLDIHAAQTLAQSEKSMAETSGKAKWLWMGTLGCFLAVGATRGFFWFLRRRRVGTEAPNVESPPKEDARGLARPHPRTR